MRKKLIAIAIILILILSVCSCATWKKSTTGYEVAGITLSSIHEQGTKMCNEGIISTEDCAKLKDLYSKTRDAYIIAGDTLIVAIKAEDAVKRKSYLEAYEKATSELTNLLVSLVKFAGNLGILRR